MHTFIVPLNIDADEWLKVYKGVAQVHCKTVDGLNLRISAKHFQPYVSRTGVQGIFVIKTTDDHQFLSINRRD